MWTKAQSQKHAQALATAEKWKEPIAKLLELAKHHPTLAQRIKDIADARDHLETTASVAIAIDPTGS